MTKVVRMEPDGTVLVASGKVELGQGARTALAQIAADELGVPMGAIRMLPASTAYSPDEGVTSGSLSIQDGGRTIREACKALETHDLSGSTLYASGEPCWMCSMVIRDVGISRVVIGELSRWDTGGYSSRFPILHEPIGRYHWFDGDGMVHAIHIEDGRAHYRNRWVASEGLKEERAAGHALYPGLLELGKMEAPKFKVTYSTAVTCCPASACRIASWRSCGVRRGVAASDGPSSSVTTR